jgi:putative sterol carrier protein
LDEKFEEISPQWKKEILKAVKMEMNEKFEEIKKEYNAKFDISFSDEDIMEIGGHGKSQKNNKKEYRVLNSSCDYFRKIVIRYNIFHYDPIKVH